jgi:hypothetical protein
MTDGDETGADAWADIPDLDVSFDYLSPGGSLLGARRAFANFVEEHPELLDLPDEPPV